MVVRDSAWRVLLQGLGSGICSSSESENGECLGDVS